MSADNNNQTPSTIPIPDTECRNSVQPGNQKVLDNQPTDTTTITQEPEHTTHMQHIEHIEPIIDIDVMNNDTDITDSDCALDINNGIDWPARPEQTDHTEHTEHIIDNKTNSTNNNEIIKRKRERAPKTQTQTKIKKYRAGGPGGRQWTDEDIRQAGKLKWEEIQREVKEGRPTAITPEIENSIIHQLVEGKTLREICKHKPAPHVTTVYKFMNENKEFFDRVMQARRIGSMSMADETKDIADAPPTDKLELYQRRLRTEVRFKLAEAYNPTLFGKSVKVAQTITITKHEDRLKALIEQSNKEQSN